MEYLSAHQGGCASGKAMERESPLRLALVALAMGLAFAGLAIICIMLARINDRIAVLWLPNAVLLSVLILRDRRQGAREIMAACFAGNMAANLLVGDDLLRAIGLATANLAEIVVARHLLQRWVTGVPDMSRSDDLLRFCCAAISATLASALVALLVLQPAGPRAVLETTLGWIVTDGLSLLVFVPTLLILANAWRARQWPDRRGLQQWCAVFAVGTATSVGVFCQDDYPLLFLVMPVIVMHAFWQGTTGAAVSILKVSTIAMVATLNGYGPINLTQDGFAHKLLILQLFLATSFLMSLPVAAALKSRQQAEAHSRNNIARYRNLVERASVGIFHVDLDGRLTDVNPSGYAISGLTSAECSNTKWFRLLRQRAGAEVVRQCHTAMVRDREFKAEITWQHPDGETRFLKATIQPEFSGDGTARSYVGTMADITELKRTEIELFEARERAEEASVAKSAFLANMSHEIRTPMNGVLGFAEVLLKGELDERQRHSVRLIAESGRAMMRLLNEILDLSKIEAGKMSIASEAVDLRHIADTVLHLASANAESEGLTLEVTVADEVPELVVGDSFRIRQILLNLVGNAIKFTEQGAIRITIRVAREHACSWLELSVSDTGIGIKADKLESIFDKFAQANSDITRQFGGSGLGLAISSELAELMGGTIRANSNYGLGSEFCLRLPLHPVHTSTALHEIPDAKAAPASSIRGTRVLIAEDHDINQHLIMEMAKSVGLAADLARDGAEAIEMVEQASRDGRPYQLVLMDMQMPQVNGIEASVRLRELGHDKDSLPIVAVTANAYPEDISACLEAGMQSHLAKPFRYRDFCETIARWMAPPRARPGMPSPAGEAPGKPSIEERYRRRRETALDQLRQMRSRPRLSPPQLTELIDSLHKLAGTAAMFDEQALGSAASQLERKLRTASPEDVSAILSREAENVLLAA